MKLLSWCFHSLDYIGPCTYKRSFDPKKNFLWCFKYGNCVYLLIHKRKWTKGMGGGGRDEKFTFFKRGFNISVVQFTGNLLSYFLPVYDHLFNPWASWIWSLVLVLINDDWALLWGLTLFIMNIYYSHRARKKNKWKIWLLPSWFDEGANYSIVILLSLVMSTAIPWFSSHIIIKGVVILLMLTLLPLHPPKVELGFLSCV